MVQQEHRAGQRRGTGCQWIPGGPDFLGRAFGLDEILRYLAAADLRSDIDQAHGDTEPGVQLPARFLRSPLRLLRNLRRYKRENCSLQQIRPGALWGPVVRASGNDK